MWWRSRPQFLTDLPDFWTRRWLGFLIWVCYCYTTSSRDMPRRASGLYVSCDLCVGIVNFMRSLSGRNRLLVLDCFELHAGWMLLDTCRQSSLNSWIWPAQRGDWWYSPVQWVMGRLVVNWSDWTRPSWSSEVLRNVEGNSVWERRRALSWKVVSEGEVWMRFG